MFHPTVSITEQVAGHLADLIVRDELPGGSRVQELKIARELGVSRGSVRESLLLLERRHLIEIVPRRGAVVNDLRAYEAIELVDTLAANQRRLLQQLMSCEAPEAIFKRLKDAVDAMEQAARDNDTGRAMDGRLQFFVALQTNVSRYTRAMFDCLLPTSQRVIYYLLSHSNLDLHDLARFYRAVYAALGSSDAARIEELLTGYQHRMNRLIRDAFTDGKQSARQRQTSNGEVLVELSASH